MATFYLMIILFVVGYACIALEHPIKINKTATALMLGVLIWLCYILTGPSIFDITGFRAGYEHYLAIHPGATFVDFITKNELIDHLGDISEILFYLMGAMTVVELIDSVWCEIGIPFHSFACGYPVFQFHLLKRLSFPYSLLLCCKSINHICVGLFLVLYSVPLIYVSVFMPIAYCFNYYSFIM